MGASTTVISREVQSRRLAMVHARGKDAGMALPLSGDRISTVLVGIDGSKESDGAARLAVTLAIAAGAELVAVHAAGLLDVWPDGADIQVRSPHQGVQALLEGEWTQPIRDLGGSARLVLRDGSPVDVLLDVAFQVDASVIVVGSRGTSAATLSTIGSTAATLIGRSSRPVLIAPSRWQGIRYADIERDALLMNGLPVHIAPAQISDLGRVRSFYRSLSDTSTYYRFFGIRRALPERELLDVVDPAITGHVTLLASIEQCVIGIGEFIVDEAGHSAEVAFAVADEHHREGIATLLLEDLAIIARRCGLTTLTAVTLTGNSDMLLVFRTVGLAEEAQLDDAGVMQVRLDLSSIDVLRARSAQRHVHAAASSIHLAQT